MTAPTAAFWSSSAADFVATDVETISTRLAHCYIQHYRGSEPEQVFAWRDGILALQAALARAPSQWWVLLEYPILRLGLRIDAVLLTEFIVIVLEFKREEAGKSAQRQVEDYALDLLYFHEHCRQRYIVPILITNGAAAQGQMIHRIIDWVPQVRQTTPEALGSEISAVVEDIGATGQAIDPYTWEHGAYRPVPTIIESACMIYNRNGVKEIAAARADQQNLNETTNALRESLSIARLNNNKIILFVTGIPGAGKTLCGLNVAFDGASGQTGTFLTGNPTLVHVLRAALSADARKNKCSIAMPHRDFDTLIQALPKFRKEYLTKIHDIPSEKLFVIDEAQRCWSKDYAIAKTRDKPPHLTDSEPGHILDVASRHQGFAGIVCLVGSGQEIHDGEGGLAEWGLALRERSEWQVYAPPEIVGAEDLRWHLGEISNVQIDKRLHLDVPIRQVRNTQAAKWVDALLRGDHRQARSVAATAPVPFLITRVQSEMKVGLWRRARGQRRAGLVASSGGRRLRAEGLGVELPHSDAAAVASWFLANYPKDIRASDALEQIATEFACQGLELDYVGLCWDVDLIRNGSHQWKARKFRGTKWQNINRPDAIANQINTYRVLLTRARYETIIFIPRGEMKDETRPPALYDSIADFLLECGAQVLSEVEGAPQPVFEPQAILL